MILEWGGHRHAQDEVGVKIEYRSLFDKFGRRMGEVQEWHILGAVCADSQAALTSAIAGLEAAYLADYQNLTLYLNDGTTPTAHQLINTDTFGGTHVAFFGYIEGPWKMQLEYANRRTFYIVVRAEKRWGTGLYAWKERLTIKGTGAAKFRYMPSMNAAPVSQTLQQSTTFFYVQQGMGIGRQASAVVPGPLFPGIEHAEQRRIAYDSPTDIVVNGEEMFMTTWQYVMEATAAQGFSAFIIPTVSPF